MVDVTNMRLKTVKADSLEELVQKVREIKDEGYEPIGSIYERSGQYRRIVGRPFRSLRHAPNF